MAKVIVDPDEVRNFARFLDQAADNIEIRQNDLDNSFRSLKEVWHDHKYQQFELVFEETSANLKRFLKLAENYADYLRRKAGKADKYLEGRY